MIRTHGLSHINLEVADPEASLRFYSELFGVKEYFRDDESIQVRGLDLTMSLRSFGVLGRAHRAE